MTVNRDDQRAPYLVWFVPADGREPIDLDRAWTRKAGLRATFGHAARLMAEGKCGAVELAVEGQRPAEVGDAERDERDLGSH